MDGSIGRSAYCMLSSYPKKEERKEGKKDGRRSSLGSTQSGFRNLTQTLPHIMKATSTHSIIHKDAINYK